MEKMTAQNRSFVEENHGGITIRYEIEKVLFSGQSEFQKVEVVESASLGRMLLNDSIVMVSEKDEFIYHDMIAHVPLFTHPCPKRVLIIGGGDGGTAREVLRHSTVEECVMVEIDGMVVDACRQYLPQISCSLDHPRLQLIIGDGVQYLQQCLETFDVILVDSTDPIGPAQPLFGEAFYRDVSRCLGDQGVVVSQGESLFYQGEIQLKLLSILHQIFPLTALYNYQNLTYPGSHWSFTFASKALHPLRDFTPSRVAHSSLEFQYYNQFIHQSAFSLPSMHRKVVEEYLSPLQFQGGGGK